MSPKTVKILKITAIVIVVLVALPFIAALFVGKDISVERSVIIDRPNQQVFDYIRNLRNQDNYSTWAAMDPDMKRDFRGTDGTVGFVSAWDSEETGKGEQEIVGITEGERIDFALRFIEPFESSADVYMATEPVSEEQTRVTWGMESRFAYPMNLMLLFMDFEELIGDDYDIGLARLKEILENE